MGNFAGARHVAGLGAGVGVDGNVLVELVQIGPAFLLAHHLQNGGDREEARAR